MLFTTRTENFIIDAGARHALIIQKVCCVMLWALQALSSLEFKGRVAVFACDIITCLAAVSACSSLQKIVRALKCAHVG
jgi:hypothetical protein